MGTTSGANAIFKGSSAYSSDFANMISRAVAIASLPVTHLTNQKASLTGQSDELTKLDGKFSALQTATQKITAALGGSAFQASVSRDNVVDVSVADGAREGVYSMKVTSIGAYETSMSTQNWSVPQDPPAGPTTFQLVVGNRNYSFTPADNSPQSVADAINLNYGNLVQATTVNVAAGDTRISLKSVTLGQTNLDLLHVASSASPTGLQQQAPTGYAISRTTATWDASGSPAMYTLFLGGTPHDFTPATNSAADVASAINATWGGQVRATVEDLGTGTSHDYRISLQSTTAGATTLDIQKDGAGLQTQQIAVTSRTSAAWNGAADGAGRRSTYNLVIGASTYSFTPADNSAASVAAAINALYGSQVHASVVDLETGGNPDLRISLQTGTGITANIQKITAANFQAEQTAGSLASYEVNSSGVTNTSTTRHIAITDGVTATLAGASGGSPVDITVTRSTAALNTAMSGFADAYNAAVDEVATQRGPSAGPLAGQAIVSQLASLLSSISTYSSNGQINGLASIGLDLGTDGHLTYNAFGLMSADLTSSAGVTAFLGSATGGGFLTSVTDALARMETPSTGFLKAAETDVKSQITKLAATISTKQSQVEALQIRMQNQMAVADALIASMEQRYSYFSGMFSAQQTANSMYK